MTPPQAAHEAATQLPYHDAADEIAAWVYKSQDELYELDGAARETWQLQAAQQRFEQMQSQVAALAELAEERGISRIDDLDSVVPLLFDHLAYKSYPMSLIEKNRFDLLTRWLSRLTTIDLGRVDVRGVDSIDAWLTTLEAQTPLELSHTSGTSGKLSFLPRTRLEGALYGRSFLGSYAGFGSEPGVRLGGPQGERMPAIYPSVRHGRYVAQRLVAVSAREIAPTPDQCYTLNDGILSADLVSLAGRIRVAQAKGELSQMHLSDGQRLALKAYLEAQERRPQQMAEFFARMADTLNGKRVFLFGQNSYLTQAAQEGLARGLRSVFAANSVGTTGGGGKDVKLPPDWRELVSTFTGFANWHLYFGMTEMVGVWPGCPQRRYHIPPYHIVYLLNPESGAVLPRQGRQTGRMAVMDLVAQHYWGGTLTGDQVTIEWTETCACGRKGPHLAHEISRYAANVTGDDKITCAETVDNTDAALQKLLNGRGALA